MMVISAGVGVLSGIFGLYFSFYANIASGPAIVLMCTAFFLLAFFFAPGRGLLARWLKDRRMAMTSPPMPAEDTP
jgi:ABC-type Mn2+/Zn2+ transport system permease subunit